MTGREDLPELPAELQELRQVWGSLEAPEPFRELEREDDATRASVAWMRAAWQELEAPAPRVPVRPHRARRSPRLLPWAAAVAAGWLVALALVLIGGADDPDPAGHGLAQGSTGGQDESPIAPLSTEPADKPVLLASLDDRVEMRSGPVRLILFQTQ